MSAHSNRFNLNFNRVKGLLKLFNQTRTGKRRTNVLETDLLRATVVFLHSSMEDYLRGVIIEHFLNKDSCDLKDITLPHTSNGYGPKFTLSELVPYKDKTISELIEQSVKTHMQKASFGNTGLIISWLKRVGIHLKTSDINLASIDEMTQRRHKIVHEADLNQNFGRGNHRTSPITVSQAKGWMDSVNELITAVERTSPP